MRKLYEIEADIEKIIEIGADRYVDGETGEIISKEDFNRVQEMKKQRSRKKVDYLPDEQHDE